MRNGTKLDSNVFDTSDAIVSVKGDYRSEAECIGCALAVLRRLGYAYLPPEVSKLVASAKQELAQAHGQLMDAMPGTT